MPRVAGGLASQASGIGQYSIRVALMIGLLDTWQWTVGRGHPSTCRWCSPEGDRTLSKEVDEQIMAHRGLKFGIFLAPFHRVGENPTLALARDMEMIEWLDHLGYDEAWIGEHHSAGWELIASPELVIAAAAERTRHIMLGSGVTSLPYHHPLLVANRFVQLDHMTRGRAMLGCGPGALTSDAYMLGIEPVTQRPRMDEALTAIMTLLRCDEPVTMKTDWFELREARLHLAPYTEPHFPIAVASTLTPAGMVAAGKHGLGVLSLAAGLPGGPEALAEQWKIGEETAARHGKRMDRAAWRLVTNVHVAEDDELALRQVTAGERHETVTYFEETLGRPPGRSDDPLRDGVQMGTTLVGSPDTVAAGIKRLLTLTQGGTGGILFRAQEWANREITLKSYELFARYVMPQFQGSLDTVVDSNRWAREGRRDIFGPNVQAIAKAYADAGRQMPAEALARTTGARDVGPPTD
jgi:limonene 1,2-monooxygenase